ncbi:pentapeptide repeat-containing protein [Kitasatospora sp. NPDC101157]|uniref:pentapeptide repeat-containing protein n=1 Tax=Kitasatospora sp. NPDC101157 TaxID=3364098 RepID=UPI0038125A56
MPTTIVPVHLALFAPAAAAHLPAGTASDSAAPLWFVIVAAILGSSVIAAIVAAVTNIRIATWRQKQEKDALNQAADLAKDQMKQTADLAEKQVKATARLAEEEMGGAQRRLSDELDAQRERLAQQLAQDRRKLLSDRFAAISAQLGDESRSARLAAVYGLAGLADDWDQPGEEGQRQTCIDVLCAYLRIPVGPCPDEHASAQVRGAWRAEHEVRHAIIGLIRVHLLGDAHTSWQRYRFDFTRAAFDGGSFKDAEFRGPVRFHGATFRPGNGNEVTFEGASFGPGCQVEFLGATFASTGSRSIVFRDTEFAGGSVMFKDAHFDEGAVVFDGARFTGGHVDFRGAEFNGGQITFDHTRFTGGEVDFRGAKFNGGQITFREARFDGAATVVFDFAHFHAEVGFWDTRFNRGLVSFDHAAFGPGPGKVDFGGSFFRGADVQLETANFNGLTVDLSKPSAWDRPPKLPPESRQGLHLPGFRHAA